MIHNLVFNVPELFLDQLLVAEHVIQLGWDGVAQVENASTSATDRKYNDARDSFLTDAAPKPQLCFRA